MAKPRLVYIVTVGLTVKSFLIEQAMYFADNGFDIVIISSKGAELEGVAVDNFSIEYVEMERKINIVKDFVALVQLIVLFLKLRPGIVNASTPKAGLLGMLAARFTNVPIRIYQQRGLRLETVKGLKR